jgi:hypothetical protein
MTTESSKAAPIELAKPLYPVRICQEEELPAVMVDAYYDSDIDAERKRWQAKVVEADKSGYARAKREYHDLAIEALTVLATTKSDKHPKKKKGGKR